MSNRNISEMSASIRLILGAGVAIAFFSPFALQAAEEDSAELERVQVTGSRLSQLDIEGAAPVTVITREDLNRVPFDSVGQLIQSLPVVTGSPVNTFTNNGGSGSVGADLRGLGGARTLVLINGRRADWAGDLNTLPIAMVERIDILKEGASSVYGADAVAGVINIITRSDFDGMELTAQQSNWKAVNAPTLKVSGIAGGTHEHGNMMVGFDFVDQEGVYQGELDTLWMQSPIAVYDPAGVRQNGLILEGSNANALRLGSSSIPGGRFGTSAGTFTLDYTYTGTGTDPNTGEGRVYDYNPNTYTGTYRPYGANGANDSYNFNPSNYIQTPNKRLSFFSQGDYEINGSLIAFFETQFQRRTSSQILAPLPYFSDFGDPGYTDPVTGVNGVSGDNFYNPFGETVSVRRRVVETGGRKFYQTQDAYRTVFGVDGRIGNNWEYEASYNYSGTLNDSTDYGQFSGQNLALALGSSFQLPTGEIVCGDRGTDGVAGTADDNVIAGCVPMNLFGGPGTITQEMLDYAGVALNDRFESRTDVLNALIRGDLFELPAGTLQGALGFERRREKAVFVPDSAKVKDLVTGNAGEGTAGAKEVNSYFAEFAIPLLEDAPFAESLDLSAGFRHDSFDTFGSATSSQIGLRWQPVSDVMVRATVGTSFREPSIGDLYSGQADDFPTASDPCGAQSYSGLSSDEQARCQAQGVPAGGWNDVGIIQLRSRVGGNPMVGPEDGDSFTFGLGWSPDSLPGFSIVVDYWSFEVSGAIGSLSAQSVLNGCIIGDNSEYCSNINRNSNGSIDTVIATTQNLGGLIAKGLDIELNFSQSTGFGDLSHRLMMTKLFERSQQEEPGLPFVALEGTFDNTYIGDSAFPELKMIYTVDWTMSDWGASARLEYISSIVDDNEDSTFGIWVRGEQPMDVEAVMYLDLTGTYHIASGTRFDFGVTNVTDQEPPFINSAFNANIDESTYRPMGTGYFVRLTQQFD